MSKPSCYYGHNSSRIILALSFGARSQPGMQWIIVESVGVKGNCRRNGIGLARKGMRCVYCTAMMILMDQLIIKALETGAW